MRVRAVILRIFRVFTISLLAVGLIAFVVVQVQERLFRHKAEQLLADFQSIRLQQSTWQDAQSFMRRWGAWGNYSGSCTASFCDYEIRLTDAQRNVADHLSERLYNLFIDLQIPTIWEHLGDHGPKMSMDFTVSNGYIVRADVSFGVYVPPHQASFTDDYSFDMAMIAESRFSLSDTKERGKWHLGSEDQLVDHPDYEVGRPGGCMFCEFGFITYTPYLPKPEVDRLTAFNFSCITRLRPCVQLGDLLPASASWHLYDGDHMGPHPEHPSLLPQPCQITPRALGRDAEVVLDVEALNTTLKTRPETPPIPDEQYDLSSVKVLNVLKNSIGANIVLGSEEAVEPYTGDSTHSSEPLLDHHHYYLLIHGGHFRADDGTSSWLEPCGVLDGTPQNLAALQLGISQDKPPQALLTESR
jgi:hypothetical protein